MIQSAPKGFSFRVQGTHQAKYQNNDADLYILGLQTDDANLMAFGLRILARSALERKNFEIALMYLDEAAEIYRNTGQLRYFNCVSEIPSTEDSNQFDSEFKESVKNALINMKNNTKKDLNALNRMKKEMEESKDI